MLNILKLLDHDGPKVTLTGKADQCLSTAALELKPLVSGMSNIAFLTNKTVQHITVFSFSLTIQYRKIINFKNGTVPFIVPGNNIKRY